MFLWCSSVFLLVSRKNTMWFVCYCLVFFLVVYMFLWCSSVFLLVQSMILCGSFVILHNTLYCSCDKYGVRLCFFWDQVDCNCKN